MSNDLETILPAKSEAINRIQAFLSNQESGVVLTAAEERILDRLIYANALLSERKFTREQIAEKIRDKFSVSVYTARNDINNTYTLFVAVTSDYKRYSLFHHIEFLQQKLMSWKDDKSLAHLIPKIADSITKAIAALPVETGSPNMPTPVVIVNPTFNITSPIAAADALKEADALIEFEKEHEYTEFTDLKDETHEK